VFFNKMADVLSNYRCQDFGDGVKECDWAIGLGYLVIWLSRFS